MFRGYGRSRRSASSRESQASNQTPGPRGSATRRGFGVLMVAALAVTLVLDPSGALPATSDAGASTGPRVLINEIATGGPGGDADTFIELANWGDEPADLEGLRIVRCGATGSRADDTLVPPLGDDVLEPGETYVIAHEDATVADIADDHYDRVLENDAFGVWLEDEDRTLIDRLAISPETRDSVCGPPLPASLDYHRAQSYQRVAATGDVADDFIAAARTPGVPNTTEPDEGVQASDVLISEVTNGGPDGATDNFIELANFSEQAADVSGWEIYRCTGDGRRQTDTLQATLPDNTVLDPGEALVAAHESVDVPDDVQHVHYDVSLANIGFGALIEDGNGTIMDAVGVYETDGVHEPAMDSACTQGEAVPNRLDFGFGDSYQRVGDTGDNAEDFVKAPRTIGELTDPEPQAVRGSEPSEYDAVQISEVAHAGPEGTLDSFFELANFSDDPVSLQGWNIHQCTDSGRRSPEPLIPTIGDVTLAPGETFLAVGEGSPLHEEGAHDATYTTSLNDEAFGLIVFDDQEKLVDRVGVYDQGYSSCTDGVSLVNFLDTDNGESYQRFQSTGDNVADFVDAERSPGELRTDLRSPADIPEDELEPVDAEPSARPGPPGLIAPEAGAEGAGHEVDLGATAEHTTGEDVELTFHGARRIEVSDRATRAFTGISAEGPPASRTSEDETPVPGDRLRFDEGNDEPFVTTDRDEFPYQRFEVLVTERFMPDEVEITWAGRSTGKNELQLYAWDHADDTWTLLDAGGGVAGGEITLAGRASSDAHVRGRKIDILVQDGPATGATFSDEANEPNLAFKDPDEYDFSFGFVADPQHVTEGYRDVYADIHSWLVANQDSRKIAYTFNVGDIIQNWMWGSHMQPRATDEFQFVSDLHQVLEDAGHAHGLIPGNHDNKWGRDNDLYNEYFPPSRYEQQPWWGGSRGAGDNHSHYDVIQIQGAKFLMLHIGYLGYFDREETVAWANQVLADHPDHNVIFSTHEYIDAEGVPTTVDNYRWTAQGQYFWDEIVAPNDNVFLVLAGHFNGVALNVKRDAGENDRTVVEMLANYQGYEHEGLRNALFARLLQFDIDAKQMAVNTYSPTLEEHNAWEYDPSERYTDADDEFTVEVGLNDIYDKRVETDTLGLQYPSEPVGSVTVADGQDAVVTWSGLEPAATYAWYVEARDPGDTFARSPVRTFHTGG